MIQPRDYEKLLDYAMADSKPITVFLLKGLPVKGNVIGHDLYVLLMEHEKRHVMIYKHAITSVLLGARSKQPQSG